MCILCIDYYNTVIILDDELLDDWHGMSVRRNIWSNDRRYGWRLWPRSSERKVEPNTDGFPSERLDAAACDAFP